MEKNQHYTPEFRELSKVFVRTSVEHEHTQMVATAQLKPIKARLDRQKNDVEQTFAKHGWECVYDHSTKLYVVRNRVATPLSLTEELMADITRAAATLVRAKFASWKNVDEACQELAELIHAMRRPNKFQIKILKKCPSKTKVVDWTEIDNAQAFRDWIHRYVHNAELLKKQQAVITAKKKKLAQHMDACKSRLEDIYRANRFVSVPIKFERKISPELTDVVALTQSNYFDKKHPRKLKRYLEYVAVPVRNTTVKKFSPTKKDIRAYLRHATHQSSLNKHQLENLVATMFLDLRKAAETANARKIETARQNPTYRLKVSKNKSNKKTTRPTKRKRSS